MKHRRYLKDNHKRLLYKKTEVLQKVLKALNLYETSKFSYSLTLRKLFCSMLVKDILKSQVKNYCIITGRSRGIFRKVRVSRISFRKLGAEGLFFGLKKAS